MGIKYFYKERFLKISKLIFNFLRENMVIKEIIENSRRKMNVKKTFRKVWNYYIVHLKLI